MAINQTDGVQLMDSLAGQALKQVGEAMLTCVRQAFPGNGFPDEPARIRSDLDDSTLPPSAELCFENRGDVNQAYEILPVDKQIDVFHEIRSAAKQALNRAAPIRQFYERDADVYVFADQSAVEVFAGQYRQREPMLLPIVRAISWQQPLLLVGDNQRPTAFNLFRLGYQELAQANDTTFYRHYDSAMPTIGHGFAAGHDQITVFRAKQPPVVVAVPNNGRGHLIDLHQPELAKPLTVGQLQTDDPVATAVGQPEPEKTRYPLSLLDQVAAQFEVQLTGENAKRLLNGQKTEVVITGDGSTGKLYVLNTPDKGPQLVLQDVRRELTLRDSYLGHVFTEQDKANLIKYGNMGRAVELTDKQSGQPFIGFVGVDEDTKTLTVLRADQIRPKIERMSHLKGVPLNGLQKQRLMEGKAIRLDNMTSKAGTRFSAFVRVSAAGRNLRFDPIPSGLPPKTTPAATGVKQTKTTPADPDAAKPQRARRMAKPKPNIN